MSILQTNFTKGDEYPILKVQSKDLSIPFQIIRFSDRKDASLHDAISFYEWDNKFENKLKEKNLPKVIPDLFKAGSIIQPDYSLFADAPLILQKMAVFKKNKVAVELQEHGLEVIPNLRWGDERSFEFAFAGIPKHQICAIGTYGQIQDKEKRYLFESGLEEALSKVEPKSVLIYGSMPDSIFASYKKYISFYQYPSWQAIYAREAC
ncbi:MULTISPECIES: DUF4417 domain-containing protein [Lactobacillus]|jgi:hypothetical protein|uniref:DUF4417 domain-containing protein n=1 Tax=Lactobacillus TaxID=1578 RepID=UPI000B98EFDE|nr:MULTISPECIES: DUF4417 domain-containing protein [Lactobacillus]MDY4730509.1 DUF4417 domain-containing protein [Lactobacillus amylovorus]MCT3341557.1 DUF4417 domain-containing protein [Lactobacillus johnsonii]MDD7005808.1 DUF4417 domain-containing protein [Lactobacillus johnsonii]MDY5419981.1 DUF4417 domain-containing protein [Lactobacillus johnsonii]MDY6194735.1 DUF4417 domain-containing protein [Lactobacillus johnsonii]